MRQFNKDISTTLPFKGTIKNVFNGAVFRVLQGETVLLEKELEPNGFFGDAEIDEVVDIPQSFNFGENNQFTIQSQNNVNEVFEDQFSVNVQHPISIFITTDALQVSGQYAEAVFDVPYPFTENETEPKFIRIESDLGSITREVNIPVPTGSDWSNYLQEIADEYNDINENSSMSVNGTEITIESAIASYDDNGKEVSLYVGLEPIEPTVVATFSGGVSAEEQLDTLSQPTFTDTGDYGTNVAQWFEKDFVFLKLSDDFDEADIDLERNGVSVPFDYIQVNNIKYVRYRIQNYTLNADLSALRILHVPTGAYSNEVQFGAVMLNFNLFKLGVLEDYETPFNVPVPRTIFPITEDLQVGLLEQYDQPIADRFSEILNVTFFPIQEGLHVGLLEQFDEPFNANDFNPDI